MKEFQWMKTDTASIMFSALTTKTWGRTFRFTAEMQSPVDAETLKAAVGDVLPFYPNMRLSLRRGFFWAYQVVSDAPPEIRPEGTRPLLPITAKYRGLPDFRLVYQQNEVSLEASHCIGDGKGIMRVFEEILTRYVYLKNGGKEAYKPFQTEAETLENAFDTYYQRGGAHDKLRSQKAFHFAENYEPDFIRLLFAETDEQAVKALAHAKKMTVTEYLSAVLILGVIKAAGRPITERITIAVPVNLRRFFATKSLRNFSIQSYVNFDPQGKTDWTLDGVCAATYGQLKETLTREKLNLTLNKFGALKYNPILRVVPYAVKRPVLVKSQNDSHASITTIFTNLGERTLPKTLQDEIKKLRFVNGDTRNYGLAVTCSCISCNGVLSLCFSRANRDTSWFDACVEILRNEGLTISTEYVEGAGKPQAPAAPRTKPRFCLDMIRGYFNI